MSQNGVAQSGEGQKNGCANSAQMGGPELYALLASGYQPIGVVIGVAVVSMGTRGFARSLRGILKKGEMLAVSQTSQHARELAMERLEQAAKAKGADLVLVHQVEVRDAAEIVEITYTGTACRKVGEMQKMPITTATN